MMKLSYQIWVVNKPGLNWQWLDTTLLLFLGFSFHKDLWNKHNWPTWFPWCYKITKIVRAFWFACILVENMVQQKCSQELWASGVTPQESMLRINKWYLASPLPATSATACPNRNWIFLIIFISPLKLCTVEGFIYKL